jgi:homoaconitase/3-isopropylmalate dehydratase large subunit
MDVSICLFFPSKLTIQGAMLQPIGWYFEGLSTTEQRNTVVADISRGAVTVSHMTQNNCVKYRSSVKYVRTYSTQTEIYLMFPMENEVILQVQEEVGAEKSAVCHIRLKEKPFSSTNI